MLRDTPYARELARGVVEFPEGSEGRLERLDNKQRHQIEIRFSWWRGGRMLPRPLDATEDELLTLFRSALRQKVFSEAFCNDLRSALDGAL